MKVKTLPCAQPNLPIFWNLTHTIIPDRQHSARFRKSQKSSISLHPTVHVDRDKKEPRSQTVNSWGSGNAFSSTIKPSQYHSLHPTVHVDRDKKESRSQTVNSWGSGNALSSTIKPSQYHSPPPGENQQRKKPKATALCIHTNLLAIVQ